nr:MAG TPA: hypothetical protein [Bacteriophage sp.]
MLVLFNLRPLQDNATLSANVTVVHERYLN